MDDKTGTVTLFYRSLYVFDNKAVMASRKVTCRDAWNPR